MSNEAPQGSPSVTFETEVASFGNNTGIVVPPELIAELGAGQRPPVDVEVNGHRYRTTVGVMKGSHLVSVSAAVRRATGLAGGDPVAVTLTVNQAPRTVEPPDDFTAALHAAPEAEAFFATLSNSLQRYHIEQVTGAKKPETRQRRIDKAISLLLAGKPR